MQVRKRTYHRCALELRELVLSPEHRRVERRWHHFYFFLNPANHSRQRSATDFLWINKVKERTKVGAPLRPRALCSLPHHAQDEARPALMQPERLLPRALAHLGRQRARTRREQ